MPQTGPPEQALAAKALLPPAAIDIAAIPASTARHERLVRRLRMLAPPGLACTGTPREMLAQLYGGDRALKRQCQTGRRADAEHRRGTVCRICAARFGAGRCRNTNTRRSRCSSHPPESRGGCEGGRQAVTLTCTRPYAAASHCPPPTSTGWRRSPACWCTD